ncbi:hypothetical protein EII22_05775 [Coriobacteriales bacterium OH1046]|nr:hypothetical protein EII22_05775 [Coriobacteriales bacterium OH1046]
MQRIGYFGASAHRGRMFFLKAATLHARTGKRGGAMNLLLDGSDRAQALLVLEDGTAFSGRSCGAAGEAIGRIAFDTDIFGYQAALADEGYRGAIVAFTYPQIGNFGVNAEAPAHALPVGIVVHDMVRTPSSWQCEKDLPAYLAEQGIVGIEDIDVRALVAQLRDRPGIWAAISTRMLDAEILATRVRVRKGGEAHA